MKRFLLVAMIALLAVGATYANSFGNGFHFDDFHTVTDNPAVRSLRNIPRFFTDPTTFSVLPENRTYRPMVSTSLALDYGLGDGYVPAWFHADTFVVFVALLVFLVALFREAMQSSGAQADTASWLALIAATWFGLHPAIAETVNYIIQRGDIYCTLGCVAGLVLWARWPRARRWGGYLVPVVLALLSKAPAAIFPALLLLWIYFFETCSDAPPSARWRRSIVSTLPALILVAAVMLLEAGLTPHSFTPSSIPAWQYRLTQPYVLLRYFVQLFLPLHLNVDTDLEPFAYITPQAMAGFLFALALLAVIVATWRRKQWAPVTFGLLWFLLAELPTSLYPLSEVENDHRMFFGFAGLVLAVVWAAWRSLQALTKAIYWPQIRPWAVALVVILLTAYANGTRTRNRVWHDEASLWLDDVQKSPHNGRGLMNYGLTRMAAGDNTGALQYYNRALQYTPNYAALEINLGIATGELGYAHEAEQHFLRAISLAADDDQPHAYYGRWLRDEARTSEAIQQLRSAVALNPARPFDHEQLLLALSDSGDSVALVSAADATLAAIPHDPVAEQMLAHPTLSDAAWWINRSLALYQRGDFAASITAANRALALDPHSAEAHNNLGAAFAAMGEYPTAIAEEKTALVLAPNFRIAQNNLAAFTANASLAGKPTTAADWINRSLALYQSTKYEESLQAAREALKLDPMDAIAWNNIAAANASLQRWPEAISAAQRALKLQPDFQLAANNLAWAKSQQIAVH